MAIGVLGPLMVDGDGASLAPRERVVLAVLAVRRGEVVSAEMLAEALWGDQLPPASWTKVVQGCVVRLRKVLGTAAIETRSQGYRLAVPAEEVDANRFERLVGRARELLTLGEPDRAVYVVDEALALWRGKALTELDEWEHGRIEAARLGEMRLDAEELRIDAALQAGHYRQVLADAQARVAQAPLREHRWTLLALAQYQAGRQGDALRTLHQARQVLLSELGLDPGPDLVALEGAILRQDPSLVAARLPVASPVCPYLGLVPYDVADADVFCGRDLETAECLHRLSKDGVLAVVGPSGSGKSSLVRAGIAAALERDGHRVVVTTPGTRPMDVFTVLSRASAPAVLIVDQCEEAVTLCLDADERVRFFAALAGYAGRAMLVVALRADRLGELSAHPEFARLVERALYLLKRMDEEHLRAAIEAPAHQAGMRLEPGLVDVLARDVEGEPGSLPLLSHALRQTWERREGSTLTVDGYQASGGIRGAVAQSAEQVYERAPAERRQMLRDLMLRLVAPSADGEPVRSRVPRRIVASDRDREQLIETLVDARLVTSDEESVELAHEALARAWPRLKDWLDDDVEGQRLWRHLAAAADTWDGMGRPDSELYRGVRLARAVEWFERTAPDLNQAEHHFLDAGTQLADAERTAAAEQARRQVRINRRLRALAAGVAVLAVAAAAGGVVAMRQARRADSAAEVARSQELVASAIGVMDEDPSLAKLLALASLTTTEPTVATSSALHRAWATDVSVARYGVTYAPGVLSADINPAGDRVVAAGSLQPDGSGSTIEVVDPYTDEPQWSVDLTETGEVSAFVTEPFFTADGQQVVAGVYWDPFSPRRIPVALDGADEPVPDLLGAHFWDAATGELIDRVNLGRCGGVVTAVSPMHVLAKTLHGTADTVERCRWRNGSIGVELVDRRTGARNVLTPATNTWWGWGAALSDDGRYAAYDDGGPGEIVVIEVASGAEVLRKHGAGVRDLNTDGSLILVGDQPIEVWDVGTGAVTAAFDGHNGPSLNARFGPTGQTVYSNGDDGALREWSATDGSELFSYRNVGNGAISLNSDGMLTVTNPDQQTITLLDTRPRGEVGAVETCAGSAAADTLTVVDGIAAFNTICGEDAAATTYVADLGTGSTLRSLPGRHAGALAVSADGTRIVSQESAETVSGPLVVHELRSGERLVELEALPDNPGEFRAGRLRWSADGALIAAALGSELAVWDAATGSLLHTARTTGEGVDVVDVLFTPDSARLVATSSDWKIATRSVESWDVVAERELSVDGGYRLGLIGFTPDESTLIAVGGYQGNTASALIWLDPETFESRRSAVNIHEGSITAAALSPSGSQVATASSDGSVRVWDVATGDLVHEVPFGDVGLQGVAYVDDEHLAVTPSDGNLLVVTTDPDELLAIVRDSLTRGFSLPECGRFNFGDDCPTLADLGAPLPGGDRADELAGTFRVEWSRDDLVAAVISLGQERFGARLTPEGLNEISDLASDLAATYTMTFADGRFDIVTDRTNDAFCTGNYFHRDGRVWLRSERGSCYPIKLFDAAFDLNDGELRFDGDTFRGELPYALVFAAGPLQRVS